MVKGKKIATLIASASIFGAISTAACVDRTAWYYHLTPQKGGPFCLVGPFMQRATAADNLGSALYSHPFACHTNPSGPNCRNIGNGYGYVAGTSYPPTYQVPDSGPVQLPFVATHLYNKWVRFWYGNDGSCTVVVKGTHPTLPPGQFTDYPKHDGTCPGWPWIWIGDNNNGQGDMVCG